MITKDQEKQQIIIDPPEPHSDKQRFIFTALQYPGIREVWIAAGTKFGKANSIYELIATPEGWKLFRDIKVGDHVFDENGNPVLVSYVTDIMYGHECYEVVFSDNTIVVCDKEHLWLTETRPKKSGDISEKSVKTTSEILDTLYFSFKKTAIPNHSICLPYKDKTIEIAGIRKTKSVPVKCIRVENESHLYLIGSGFIPTHNTLGGTVAQINAAIQRPNTKHRWVAPIYSQTRQPLEYFRSILPKPPITKPNKAENTIEIPSFGTRFEFWHAQNPGSLEGDGIHSYVFDEAAKQPPDIRASARTTTTATKGPMVFISYPLGKNWFYTGCMEAKEHMEWAYKHGKPYEKIFIHARTIDNPKIDPIVIERAKKELPNNLYRQFYLAEFIDEFTVFGDIEPCIFGEKLEIYGDVQQWYAPDRKEAHVVIGGDWAKAVDYTVFVAIDMKKYRVCGFMRFQKKKYTEAVRLLSIFSMKFGSVEMIIHDKTGVGSAIDEHLAYINQPFTGVTLTNALKSDFVLKLITSIEQKEIGLPNWIEMKNELKSYECTPNKIGTMSYNATSGRHDDIVCALFLANYGYLLYAETRFDITYLDELAKETKDKTELEKFYLDIYSDDEE